MKEIQNKYGKEEVEQAFKTISELVLKDRKQPQLLIDLIKLLSEYEFTDSEDASNWFETNFIIR